MVSLGIINKNEATNSPLVYSYGQLRVGDGHFVNTVNSMFKVIRIVKNGDYFPRLPNCVYSPQLKKWRCYRDTYNLYLKFPEYRKYIMHYAGRKNFEQYQTGIQTAYGNYSPLRSSFLEKKAEKKTSRNKSKIKSKKGVFWNHNNPGQTSYAYGSVLNNQGARSYGGVYYSQPMGAEVFYSNRFKKFQVCTYFKGIPNCEKQLPKNFKAGAGSNYFGTNVENC